MNPNLKGGYIDIYIEVSSTDKIIEKKLEYLVKLKDAIGEQKIDLIVKQKGCKEFICEEAKKKRDKIVKNIKFIIEELEKHKEKLLYSKNKIENWGKLSEDDLNDPEKVETMDSFIFRFCKMQDSMGEKLFPATLTHTYPLETEEILKNIRLALEYSEILTNIYEKIKNYLKKRGVII